MQSNDRQPRKRWYYVSIVEVSVPFVAIGNALIVVTGSHGGGAVGRTGASRQHT